MKRTGMRVPMGRAALIAALQVIVFASYAAAQFGGAAPPPSTQATPLPLSGRNAQGGGVVATQSAVPSTTTSVNTLNSTVSVQGAYSGSTSSTAQLPFSGKLSLAEAIQRGASAQPGRGGFEPCSDASSRPDACRAQRPLPNIRADVNDTEETFNLRSIGFNFSTPGFLASLCGRTL